MQPRYTVVEIAERLHVDKEVARGFVRYLVAINLATVAGERRPEGGRGRAEIVYSFVPGFEKSLAASLEDVKLT